MMQRFGSFGRVSAQTATVLTPQAAIQKLRRGRVAPASLLAYGNGRSYGDTCQNTAGSLIDMRLHRRTLDFDDTTGLLTAEAGVQLAHIINVAGPAGYFPPVAPGTRFVTLGGAIANDIHGKNHHRRGSFGSCVESLELMRSDGRVMLCSRYDNADMFSATIGGMGLTGLILSATIRLMPVAHPDVIETAQAFSSLDEYFDLAERADADNEYAVAWIDQTAQGRDAGRGILLTGNHVEKSQPFRAAGHALLSVPFQPPFTVLSTPAIRLFNRAYRWAKLRGAPTRRASWQSFFFPLDGVRHWHRLYGPAGLYQHQSVIPCDAACHAVPVLLAATHAAGQASFLTVLKRFGTIEQAGLISFARPGYTLTLDFANRGLSTQRLLDELDTITIDAGGAVNPYKDARMSPRTFETSFPQWRKLEQLRDPAFNSDFWRRTALALAGTPFALAAE